MLVQSNHAISGSQAGKTNVRSRKEISPQDLVGTGKRVAHIKGAACLKYLIEFSF